ncbi:MAG: hypothetical protein EON95_17280 [Caulobacteraceae bacterium]|nr:MAG: hypothetical protein EON95_17280 [Caulobacteraceae bacterium]
MTGIWMRKALLAAGLCALLAPAAGVAAPDNVAPLCPARLKTEQTAQAPAGWTAQRLNIYQGALMTVLLSDGPPAEQAYLAPDESRAEGSRTTNVWVLGRNRRNIWLTCQYDGADVALTRRLPADIIECEAIYDDNLGTDSFQAFSCHR